MLAASCSDNDGKNFFENKTEKITLRFWMNPWIITPPGFPEGKTISNEDYPAWISKKFMEKFPGVKIEYTVVSNKELKQKISSAIAAGNPPDVFKYFDTKFAQAGLLEPVDEYLTEADKNDFLKQCIEAGEYNGKHYMWPFNYGTNGVGAALLLYKERFVEKGIDIEKIRKDGWTMEEFLDICKKLSDASPAETSKRKYAIALAAKDEINILNFIYAFGGRLFDESEKKIILNSPETAEAFNFLLDLIYKYKVCAPGVEAMDFYNLTGMFHQHKTAIGFGGPYEIGRIEREYKKKTITEKFLPVVVPFPHIQGKKTAAHLSAGGFIVFKQKNEKKKKYAMEFAKFLTNSENIKLLESLNYITARKSANASMYQNSPVFPEIQAYSDIIEKFGGSLTGSEKVHYSVIQKYIVSLCETVFFRKKSVQQALNEFDENVKNLEFRVDK